MTISPLGLNVFDGFIGVPSDMRSIGNIAHIPRVFDSVSSLLPTDFVCSRWADTPILRIKNSVRVFLGSGGVGHCHLDIGNPKWYSTLAIWLSQDWSRSVFPRYHLRFLCWHSVMTSPHAYYLDGPRTNAKELSDKHETR
jgi:hypothetical protein